MVNVRVSDDWIFVEMRAEVKPQSLVTVSTGSVVTGSERRGRPKTVQQGDREWASIIASINAIGWCRRPSAVVNLNCVTNRVAPGSRYKLSYDAEQYNTIHTLLNIPYLQPPHPTVRHRRILL